MVCLRRPYSFKFFKGCLPKILLGSLLNTLPHMAYIQFSWGKKLLGKFIKNIISPLKKHPSLLSQHPPPLKSKFASPNPVLMILNKSLGRRNHDVNYLVKAVHRLQVTHISIFILLFEERYKKNGNQFVNLRINETFQASIFFCWDKIFTQLTFTCSKSTIETLEKEVKYVQSYLQKHQKDVHDVVLVFLLLTLNILHTFFERLYCSV